MRSSSTHLIVLLDSGPLSMITHPQGNKTTLDCKEWFKRLTLEGHRVLVPAITDYEVRRELMRASKREGINHLNELGSASGFLHLTQEALHKAAEFWAEARIDHHPGADDIVLDADMILAAQAETLNSVDWGFVNATIVIATTNPGHLVKFADARLWQDI